jgi:hypothetical protein
MALQRQDIAGELKDILIRIKGLIQAGKVTTEERKSAGWRYGGKELNTEIDLLNATLEEKYKVSTKLLSNSTLTRPGP